MPTKHQKEVIALAKEQKTNVMRILDKAKIPYTAHYYEHNDNEPFDGVGVAKKLGQNPELKVNRASLELDGQTKQKSDALKKVYDENCDKWVENIVKAVIG